MKKSLYRAMAIGTSAASTMSLMATVALAQKAGTGPLADVEIGTPTGFATDFGGLMSGVLSFVMVIAALLVFFYLIWGGIEWITSGGDKGQTEKARNKITAAVIGLVILASAYAILTLALNFLGFTNLKNVFESAGTIKGAPTDLSK